MRSGAHRIFVCSRTDYSQTAKRIGVKYCRTFADVLAAARAEIKDDPNFPPAYGFVIWNIETRYRLFYCSNDLLWFSRGLDCVVLAPSILAFESVLSGLCAGESETNHPLAGFLVVDVLSVKLHPKMTMLAKLAPSTDILCTHPMFGPESGKTSWKGLPLVYDVVRVAEDKQWRMEAFLRLFSDEGCRMVNMSCETHDECAAGSQFITHFTGRVR